MSASCLANVIFLLATPAVPFHCTCIVFPCSSSARCRAGTVGRRLTLTRQIVARTEEIWTKVNRDLGVFYTKGTSLAGMTEGRGNWILTATRWLHAYTDTIAEIQSL
jgi:hypothetical protein